MNVYIDSSVLLRIVLGEPDPLATWDEITTGVSSTLIRLEGLRTIDRARIIGRLDDAVVSDRRAAVLQKLRGLDFIPVTPDVLDRAAEPFPTSLGSLDAIHLASALLARQAYEGLVFATHDAELGIAARSVGFSVDGVAL